MRKHTKKKSKRPDPPYFQHSVNMLREAELFASATLRMQSVIQDEVGFDPEKWNHVKVAYEHILEVIGKQLWTVGIVKNESEGRMLARGTVTGGSGRS